MTFLALLVLTYVSGKAISAAERELEEEGYAGVSESVGAEPAVEEDEPVAGELEASNGADGDESDAAEAEA